jgi:DNA invertase Pin-like site-specific DNA recombinase
MRSMQAEHPGSGSVKVTPAHLERSAVIYVRQSSPKQVRVNVESQHNQRALVDRALALGWQQARITVLDADLGQSGTSIAGREAFTHLTAEVALGHVGIIFGWEVSRLARNNADWYQLLDLAALVGTLIADVEGVYDARAYNDRLLLGLKGTMSEAELHMMRQRLEAGRLSKIRRGEYAQILPTGLVRQPDGQVALDPDEQVRHTIALVLTTFATLGSAYKTVRCLKRGGVLLPRRQVSGACQGQVLWKQPSAAAVLDILHNPAYAGAFVFGRRPVVQGRRRLGTQVPARVRTAQPAWLCCLQGIYPAYISWEQYQANQDQLRDNAHHWGRDEQGRGAPRQGPALLQGLATCGVCGHRMHVAYKAGVRYLCAGQRVQYAERMCASLDGRSIEHCVAEAFFAALQPAQLDALEALLAQQRHEGEQLARHWREQRQRASYEAHLARRRYEAVDPDNRLVAATLERAWEEQLAALRALDEAAARSAQALPHPTLAPDLREQLLHIAETLPALWREDHLTNEHKKLLLRSLIARVILTRIAPDRVEVKIVWVSGHFTVVQVTPPVHRHADVQGYAALVARVEALWQQGHTDAAIAAQVTQEGFSAARGPRIDAQAVRKIRQRHGWESHYHRYYQADRIDGYWTLPGLAKELEADPGWLYRQVYRGTIPLADMRRITPDGGYLIRDDPHLLALLKSKHATASRHHDRTESHL